MTQVKISRAVLIEQLRARDGVLCQYPDCNRELDFDLVILGPEDSNAPLEVTIDHWIPQVYGKNNGWSMERIWHIDNLKLMHKKCNAKKGDLIPNEDGTLPAKATSSFKFRRDRRATRRELCGICDNGHNLSRGEVCASCGCDAQRYPREAKVKASECDHAIWWCAWCSIGVIPRRGATEMLLIGGEGGDE